MGENVNVPLALIPLRQDQRKIDRMLREGCISDNPATGRYNLSGFDIPSAQGIPPLGHGR